MNFNIPFEMNFSMATLFIGIYLIAIGVAYYFIFRKHHKKNKVELDELINLVTKFYTLTMLTTVMIIFGIACILRANDYKESRMEVISWVLFGITVITISITNYVFYIKKNLQDLDQEVRTATRKANVKIGEIIEIIFFTIFITMPIWRIPVFIETFSNKKVFVDELIRAFGLSIASIVLLVALNPINIKEKIKALFTKKTYKEEVKKVDGNKKEKTNKKTAEGKNKGKK